jgi:hypothetical protein
MSDLKDLLAGTGGGHSSSSSSSSNAVGPVMQSALFGDLSASGKSSSTASSKKRGKAGQGDSKHVSADALGSEMAALDGISTSQKTKKKSGGLLREVSQLISSSSSSSSALGAPIDSFPTLVS